MSPCERGRLFEEQASRVLEQEGYQIKRWFSKEKWSSPCDMLIEKEGKEIYCEVRGVTKEKAFIIFSAQKMASLQALAEHTPMVLFLIRNGEHKIVPIEDLPRERYVSYPQKTVASNYYRTLEQLTVKQRTKMPLFKAKMSDRAIKRARIAKVQIDAKNNAEFIEKLIDAYDELRRSKGRNIL